MESDGHTPVERIVEVPGEVIAVLEVELAGEAELDSVPVEGDVVFLVSLAVHTGLVPQLLADVRLVEELGAGLL